jgi:DNA-binding protein YbaB
MLPPALIQKTDDEFDDTLNHDINDALTETEQQQEETMKQHRA